MLKTIVRAKTYAKVIEAEEYQGVDSRRVFKNPRANYYKKYGELRAYERWQVRIMIEKAWLAGRRSR